MLTFAYDKGWCRQVNTAGRDAAISPGSSDALAAFAGTYATHLLPAADGSQVTKGAEITVKVNAEGERQQPASTERRQANPQFELVLLGARSPSGNT